MAVSLCYTCVLRSRLSQGEAEVMEPFGDSVKL